MPPSKSTKSAPKKPAAPPKAAAAFTKVEAEMDALKPGELAVINIDIPHSVAIALGVLPNLAPLRPMFLEHLPKQPIALFDKLETYALAAWYAHLLALPGAGPSNPIKVLLEEAVPLRANLLGDALALARRGLLDANIVEDIRAGQGNVDIANDLVALSALFAGSWNEISDKTAATEAEFTRAGNLGPLLLAALGVREHGAAPSPADAADRRARAFTLFSIAYNEIRRSVCFLRWNEGDADEIVPSLYKGRGGRGAASASSTTATAGSTTATGGQAAAAGAGAEAGQASSGAGAPAAQTGTGTTEPTAAGGISGGG